MVANFLCGSKRELDEAIQWAETGADRGYVMVVVLER
jgi:hypothetical protein